MFSCTVQSSKTVLRAALLSPVRLENRVVFLSNIAPQTRPKPNPATNSKKCLKYTHYSPIVLFCEETRSTFLSHRRAHRAHSGSRAACRRFVQFPYLVSCKTLHAPSTLNNFEIPSFHYNYPATPSKTNTPQQPPNPLKLRNHSSHDRIWRSVSLFSGTSQFFRRKNMKLHVTNAAIPFTG